MFIADNFKQATIALANFPTGGSLGTAAVTVDIASSFSINQTTIGQVLTAATPTDARAGDQILINNTGTANFTINGLLIPAGTSGLLNWTGSAYSYDANVGLNRGTYVTVASIAAGTNLITHNLNLVTPFNGLIFQALSANGQETGFKEVTGSCTANAYALSSPVAIAIPVTFRILPLN